MGVSFLSFFLSLYTMVSGRFSPRFAYVMVVVAGNKYFGRAAGLKWTNLGSGFYGDWMWMRLKMGIYDEMNAMHNQRRSLGHDNVSPDTQGPGGRGLQFPYLSITKTADIQSSLSSVWRSTLILAFASCYLMWGTYSILDSLLLIQLIGEY